MVAKSTTERHARGFGYRQRNESIRDAFQCVYGTREGAFYNQQDRGCSSMSGPAAIIASLVDVRNIAEHSSVVLKIHVPQERALEVIAAFGWPTGANPVPVAIARLDTNVAPPKLVEALGDVEALTVSEKFDLHAAAIKAQEEAFEAPKKRRAFCDLPFPQQAGIKSDDLKFQLWLSPQSKPGEDCADVI